MNANAKILIPVVAVLIAIAFIPLSVYVVDERELAVVLQFGRPVQNRTQSNWYTKIPFVQDVRKLPKTRQFWGGALDDVLPDLPTNDGKKVEVIPWAIWRITDPKKFVTVLVTEQGARQLVQDTVRGATRDVITKYRLVDLVRSTERELSFKFRVDTAITGDDSEPGSLKPEEIEFSIGRDKIIEEIKTTAIDRLEAEGGENRGIELLDVGIAKIDFVPMVREAAFDRLIALMNASAAYYNSQGERERKQILNSTEAQVQRIEGEGQQESSTLRGEVDAEVIDSYAAAIKETGEFYAFIRTLEAYKVALTKDTQLILTTNNEFFKLLKQPDFSKEMVGEATESQDSH